MNNDHILEMKNIHKSFGGLRALVDVTLQLRKSEIVGLVGDNAAGKSTLMKILTGAYNADSGTIVIEDQEVFIKNPHVSRALGIEMVYQDLELCQNLDVPANLFLGREVISSSGVRFLKKRTMAILDLLTKESNGILT